MLEKFISWIKSARAGSARYTPIVLEKLRRFTGHIWDSIEFIIITLVALTVAFGISEGYFGNCVFSDCIVSKEEDKILTRWLIAIGLAAGFFSAYKRVKNHELMGFIGLALLGGFDNYLTNYIIKAEETITLTKWLTLVISIAGLFFLNKRIRNQDKQIQLQTDKEIDDRFTAAVTLLGNAQTSARTGAVYSLHELAVKYKKYRNQVAQILCSHIRSKTQESDYPKNHGKRPSNEIQTTIDLLFRDTNGLKGIYQHAEFSDLPSPNLSRAYLAGADFHGAQCKRADFRQAQCQHADFRGARCQRAIFSLAQCQGANFWSAKCQGADFRESQCQGANFWSAKCQGADFRESQCQGAGFWHAQCQGANFRESQHQGADFQESEFQGVDFWSAEFQGACFSRTNLKGAHSSLKNETISGRIIISAKISLSQRIGINTDLSGVIFSGKLEEKTIQAIENAKAFLSDAWYQQMQQIIDANKGEPVNAGIDASDEGLKKLGIITGLLEDSKAIQEIDQARRRK